MFVCLSVCLCVNYILGDEGGWVKSVNGNSWAIYQGRSSLCFLTGQALFRTPGCPEWCPVEKKPVKMAEFERFLENLTHLPIEYLIQILNEGRR